MNIKEQREHDAKTKGRILMVKKQGMFTTITPFFCFSESLSSPSNIPDKTFICRGIFSHQVISVELPIWFA